MGKRELEQSVAKIPLLMPLGKGQSGIDPLMEALPKSRPTPIMTQNSPKDRKGAINGGHCLVKYI